MGIIAILIAFVLDLCIGDPYSWPHPVKAIGHYITLFLKLKEKWKINPYIIGIILWLTTVGLTVGISALVLHIGATVHPILYWILWVYMAYTSLATRSLAYEAKKVYQKLTQGTLDEARTQVGMIVGRETAQLSKEEICKATIETVAENASDGVIGPLMCLFIGGPILAMGYKAINTLDSMVGYKHERYYKIGFTSAKIDDIVNLVPARVTFVMLLLATHVLQYDVKQVARLAWRDRYNHASPNSAFPESVVAAALRIQLGGVHVYHGELVEKQTIGDNSRQVDTIDIMHTVTMLYIATCLSVILGSIVSLVIHTIQ
ncbi:MULTISPECIES: adenosylcobinamide-phosphate synthase CbiB [unclassified Granulicatella]|uniref:adenosylcobinamide-phosphate synthase CbiB n=1 Tax=unclassified Granulicatella TaxID=2630493 RepID=UPI00188350CF|nr:adenosylcobinamide-phosphate synthase CbiB [Granulicatella sp. WM01]MBF0779510.1 cobalamin biosynthesis protein CobD [Granulicatella sp. 19428wC4_WM01]